MVPRRRGARGLASGMRTGWLLTAAAAAGAGAAALHLHHGGHAIPLALRPAATAAPQASPPPPVRGPGTGAPDTTDHTPAATSAPTTPSPTPAAPVPPPTPTPAPAPRPSHAPVRLAPAPLAVEPGSITESVAAGSPYSPLITLTVTATGHAPVVLGVVTTTVPAFHLVRDGCSRARMNPGDVCHITLQLSGGARGRHTGSLIVPVSGAAAATARLDGTVG